MRHLVTFSVRGVEPTPWTVPIVAMKACSDGRRRKTAFRPRKSDLASGRYSLVDWQRYVHDAAKEAMSRSGYPRPLTAPVSVDYLFVATTPPGYRHGQLWDIRLRFDPKKGEKGEWKKLCRPCTNRQDADTTNLVKATEDALEGAVFVNDAQVRRQSCLALYGPVPGVRITVHVIEPTDFPGEGEILP